MVEISFEFVSVFAQRLVAVVGGDVEQQLACLAIHERVKKVFLKTTLCLPKEG